MDTPTMLPSLPSNGSVAGPSDRQESTPAEQATWKTRYWDNDHLVALRFTSSEELDAAIDWLWADPEMRHLPRVHIAENTMAIPAQAEPRFARQGFRYTVCPVVSAGDLSAEEVNRIRAGARA